jgi:hypothetical protein
MNQHLHGPALEVMSATSTVEQYSMTILAYDSSIELIMSMPVFISLLSWE